MIRLYYHYKHWIVIIIKKENWSKILNIKSVLFNFLRVKIGIARRNGAVGANSRSLKKMI